VIFSRSLLALRSTTISVSVWIDRNAPNSCMARAPHPGSGWGDAGGRGPRRPPGAGAWAIRAPWQADCMPLRALAGLPARGCPGCAPTLTATSRNIMIAAAAIESHAPVKVASVRSLQPHVTRLGRRAQAPGARPQARKLIVCTMQRTLESSCRNPRFSSGTASVRAASRERGSLVPSPTTATAASGLDGRVAHARQRHLGCSCRFSVREGRGSGETPLRSRQRCWRLNVHHV
jgi:hypothetical protein